MVIGNKSDLSDSKRVVSQEAASRFVKDLGPNIEHIETSAKDSTNIEIAFASLAKKANVRQ